MTKFSALTVLLFCAMAVATAQDTNNAGGQAGSVTSDANAPTTFPPATTAPPKNAVPAGMNPATIGVPVPPAAPATGVPAPAWAANPAPTTDSGSGSFGSDIETPVVKKPKRTGDSSRAQSSTPTPSEDSGSLTLTTTTVAWALVGTMGLAAML
ncbi:hypothetical protein PRIC2_011116 [Phytophthora ramorum]